MAVLLAPLVFQGAIADDGTDTARAAVRRASSANISTGRKNTTTTRATGATKSTGARDRDTATNVRVESGARTTARGTANEARNVSARTTSNVLPRATPTPKPISATTSRTSGASTVPREATRTPIVARTATRTPQSLTSTGLRGRATSVSRNATNEGLREQIMSRNFNECKTVYYECMDEFCANKDAQLKRCACSARVNEFDTTKKQLANVEDKLMEFSQRLLTVNLDKEDAAAINIATEGETAFDIKDKSESKKMLDSIAKKLNTSFDDSNFNQDLAAISLSLNMDAAFDNVDSLAGASTTTKAGTALYTAALPVCREMAAEVCTPQDLSIVESGYQMTIEQDCNTVSKSYQTQVDKAREQVLESSALLDMSRLDIHQKRNSDDILTCKSKMLEMLTDTTVCGTDLIKCLDTTGRYIDPSTGEAFLTVNLIDLNKLIVRPTGGDTWAKTTGNEKFVSYLNSKKKFLEPAMEKCQDIADTVWDNFMEDALGQIKLAQDKKLEEVRQSCTTLTTQCLADTAESIEEFDARALSTFGVLADKTVNEMCTDVRNACTALLESAPDADTDWSTGMTGIATNKTYDTIIQTCTEVGRSCIIQACKSISGNFGLCENIDTSVNRKSIINRTACWGEVVQCIRDAGAESLANIRAEYPLRTTTINDNKYKSFAYNSLYGGANRISHIGNSNRPECNTYEYDDDNKEITGISANCIYDICTSECVNINSEECYICRFAERIWGNCESAPTTSLDMNEHNQIKIPNTGDTDTLLAWFAKNTGTADMPDSCRDTTCGIGFTNYCADNICSCRSNDGFDSAGEYCTSNKITIYPGITNCCNTNSYNGNCCREMTSYFTSYPQNWRDNIATATAPTANNICTTQGTPSNSQSIYASFNSNNYMICINGTVSTPEQSETTITPTFPNGTDIECSGYWLLVYAPNNGTTKTTYLATTHPSMYLYYKTADGTYYHQVTTEVPDNEPTFKHCNDEVNGKLLKDLRAFQVTYSNPCTVATTTSEISEQP